MRTESSRCAHRTELKADAGRQEFLDVESVRAALTPPTARSSTSPLVARRPPQAAARPRRLLRGGASRWRCALPPERAIWLLAFLPVWILVAKLAGLYDADHRALRHLTVDEAPAIVRLGRDRHGRGRACSASSPRPARSTTGELAVGRR